MYAAEEPAVQLLQFASSVELDERANVFEQLALASSAMELAGEAFRCAAESCGRMRHRARKRHSDRQPRRFQPAASSAAEFESEADAGVVIFALGLTSCMNSGVDIKHALRWRPATLA